MSSQPKNKCNPPSVDSGVPAAAPAGWCLTVVAAVMVTLYLTSNVMAVKLVEIGGVCWCDAGTITFPLVYMLGDVLTEIWGFRTARRVIWLVFGCNVLMISATSAGLLMPSPDYQQDMAAAYRTIFAGVPRIIVASLAAFLAGEMANAWALIKIRNYTGRRLLWVRTIGSSVVGYLLDTTVFVVLAFAGTAAPKDLVSMLGMQFVLKMVLESTMATPAAYGVIALIRKYAIIPEERHENL